MSKRRTTHQIIMRRTIDIFRHQKDRAKKLGKQLSYNLSDIRAMLDEPFAMNCIYCNDTLTPKNFSYDHAIPVSRGGTFDIHNLRVCCDRCNQTKGRLTGTEFYKLLNLLW